MILDAPFPPDIRVEKEARSLIRNGYDVHLLCVGEKHESVLVGDIFVHRIVIDRSSIYNRLLHTRPLLNFFHINYWQKKLLDLHYKENFSVFHAHDLTTSPCALLAGKKTNTPVILDLHENFPEAQKAYQSYNKKRLPILSIQTYWLYRLIEKMWISNSYYIITVVKERKNQLVNQGFDESKISILSNTADVNYILKIPLRFELMQRYKEKFVVTYIGGFGVHRGLNTLLKSVTLIKDKINDLRLILVGGSFSEVNNLKMLCHRLAIENFVEFVGWTDFQQIPSYIQLSKICIIPHTKSGHTDSTIPHKLFQYMLFEKPVIATDCLPLKRIIQECECGVIFKSGDPNSLADAILSLYNNPSLLEKLGINGKKAVISKYNWKKSEKTLLNIYKKAITPSS
jgi:glycosyltransferase involved in cell wall biosynthesis